MTGLQYLNGPVNVAVVYDRMNVSNNLKGGKTTDSVQAYAIAGSYVFEVVKVAAAFGQTRNGMQDLGSFRGADGFRANSYMLGAEVPMSRHFQRLQPGLHLRPEQAYP